VVASLSILVLLKSEVMSALASFAAPFCLLAEAFDSLLSAATASASRRSISACAFSMFCDHSMLTKVD
jgi:hypothetical protein